MQPKFFKGLQIKRKKPQKTFKDKRNIVEWKEGD